MWPTSLRYAREWSGDVNRMLTVAVAAAVAGCATGKPSRQPDAATDTVSVVTRDTVRVLAQVQQSGWDTAAIVVVTDALGYNSAWTTMHAGAVPVPTAPVIDFADTRVVFVASGMRPSGGYTVLLGAVRVTRDSVTAEAVIQGPGANCSVTAVLTQPAIAFAVPRTAARPIVSMQQRAGPSC